ncbi:MAG: type II toxin-antitoxin system VapC family toxin [Chloroflexi bacterium]|nr:type II toxin-antitoxin system VapC family toxin [Chloroflexota bacterium]
MSDAVVDASVVLAILFREPGADNAARAIGGPGVSLLSSVNLAEVFTRLTDARWPPDRMQAAVARLRLEIRDFDAELAFSAGLLRTTTRQAGLSLGDRACLALGMRLALPVVTADRTWAELGLPVEVVVVR